MIGKPAFGLGWLLLMLLPAAFGQPACAQTPPDYFARVAVDDDQPYVGEVFVYEVEMLVASATQLAPTLSRAPLIDLWRVDTISTRARETTIDGRAYTVVSLQYLVYALRPGRIVIPPAEIEIRDLARNVVDTVETESLDLMIRPLPSGAPNNFSRAIGQFTLTATVDASSVALGETLRLSVQILGEGNLEQVQPPAIGLPDGWRLYARPTQYERGVSRRVGIQTFEWLVIPSTVGTYTLRDIVWFYFDDRAEVYRRLAAEPLAITVVPGEMAVGPDVLASPADATIKPVPATLNHTAMNLDDRLLLIWAAPFAVLLLVAAGAYTEHVQTLRSRQQNALKIAQRRLRAFGKRSPALMRELPTIMLDYFRHRAPASAQGLTVDNLTHWMDQQQIDEALQDDVLMCIQAAEAIQFAPSGTYTLQAVYSRARTTLRRLDKQWSPTL